VSDAGPGTINIIGCGRAAGSLARLWLQAGSPGIGAILNRSRSSAARAVQSLGAGVAVGEPGQLPPAPFWMIGVNDDQIESVARQLAKSGAGLEGAVVFHLCGRHSVDILAPLTARGCRIAAVHPVRSLTRRRMTLDDFAGTACVAEGEADTLEELRGLFESIGGVWMPVQGVNRGLYHAAVSIISNITKAVAWKAQNWLEHSGLTAQMASDVTHKLLASTLDDVSRAGARQSITGPIVRGDTRTIEAHLDALRSAYPRDIDVYRVLARTVLELARERGDLDDATLTRFERLLGDPGP
jgi:predicted short-subunit dehydrogenase-like oxidoreductase (DUF2520 family)